ncbi:hypothetical protein HPGCJGGD_4406 [Methylobacterium haplocladii]|nr:hypothetical protein HPGCJGGD_4406 [Methylobacterium haplocladii]
MTVGGGRHGVERGQRGHHRVGPGADAGAERRQVRIVEFGRRHPGHVVVAPAIDGAVAGEVLERGGDAAVAKPLDLGRGELAGEPGILAEPLDDAAPAQVARHVGHRRERPVDARGQGLAGSRSGCTPHEIGIEARRHADRQREHRAVAVNDVQRDQQRDAEPRGPGVAVDVGGEVLVGEVDDGANLAATDTLRVESGLERDEVELSRLLLERHLGEQRLDAVVDGLGSGGHAASRQQDGCQHPTAEPRRLAPHRHSSVDRPRPYAGLRRRSRRFVGQRGRITPISRPKALRPPPDGARAGSPRPRRGSRTRPARPSAPSAYRPPASAERG